MFIIKQNQTNETGHICYHICHKIFKQNLLFLRTLDCLFLISLFLRYAHGPVPLQSQHYTTSQDIINSVSCIQHEMANYKPNLTQVGLSSSPVFRPLTVNTSVTKST